MIAESWNEVNRSTLIKSWKKLWPGVCDLPENKLHEEGATCDDEKESNEKSSEEFIDLFHQIDDCSDVDASDIDNWLETDNDGGYGALTDEEIIASCSSKDADNETDEDTEHQPKVISHEEATSSLEKLMGYFERQPETTPAELLMLKRMRDRTARKRYAKLKQQKLTFFSPNM